MFIATSLAAAVIQARKRKVEIFSAAVGYDHTIARDG
jgi:hypothetical protein